jgi:hypothetical protein
MMKKMGRAMWVGYKLIEEGLLLAPSHRCVCADGEVCPRTKKQNPKDLDIADVVRDVVDSP